jgi:hypothetical protein
VLKLKSPKSITLKISNYFMFRFLNVYFRQQQKSRAYFVKLVNWWIDPKWRIKNRFFSVTLRVSKKNQFFFLHSFGVIKALVLRIFFKSKMAAGFEKIVVVRLEKLIFLDLFSLLPIFQNSSFASIGEKKTNYLKR